MGFVTAEEDYLIGVACILTKIQNTIEKGAEMMIDLPLKFQGEAPIMCIPYRRQKFLCAYVSSSLKLSS